MTIPSAPPLPPTTWELAGFQFAEEDLDLLRAALPEKAKEQQANILRFWRELPRLLTEGHQGRFALIHSGQLISLWDTLGDATQTGQDKFGADGQFLTSPISDLELLRLRQYLTQLRRQACPS